MTVAASLGNASVGVRTTPRIYDQFYALALIYLWALQFIRGDSVELVSMDIGEYLFVIPAAALALVSAAYVVMTTVRLRRSSIVAALFLLIVVAVSLQRGDRQTIASLGLLIITIIGILEIRPAISISLINTLFFLSIPINSLLYYFDYSIYTFIPGIGQHPDFWWRISLFPSAAEGGLFAMVVFLANLALRGQKGRLGVLLVAAYFVVFAGNRTAIFAAVIGGIFIALRNNGRLTTSKSRAWFAIAAATAFLFSIFSSNLLLILPFADNSVLRLLIFREEAVGSFDVGDQVGTAAIRQWIFQQHWAAFRQSPLTGIGTFDFRMLTSGYGVLDDSVTGSEAFVTALLARVGLISLFFFGAIFLFRHTSEPRESDLSLCAKLALLIGMITYGSFVNAYDVVFILLMLAIAGTIYVPVTGFSSADTARRV